MKCPKDQPRYSSVSRVIVKNFGIIQWRIEVGTGGAMTPSGTRKEVGKINTIFLIDRKDNSK